VLTALSACEKADFVFLRSLTGLTQGNLSSHPTKLEQGGLVSIEKTFQGKQPITYVALTGEGRDVARGFAR
jgi:DNA-binding MarR family transcriptional regulator